MAQVQNRKSNFYSQKQSIRDELSAPPYLESAGDVLIKHLARKQTNTRTSLQEQLEIVQHFEKGFELSPDNRKGVTCWEEFKKHEDEQSDAATPTRREQIRDLDELMKVTGLTRHELELGLCEKPNSAVSQLYMFAIGNKRQVAKSDTLHGKWSEHPINRLKEIEEECFGLSKKKSRPPDEKARKKDERRNKRRKRKRKGRKARGDGPGKSSPESEPPKAPLSHDKKEPPKAPCPRPSLWDVKDMKKWAETKQIGCRPPALYTIKDGQIIKLGDGRQGEDVTDYRMFDLLREEQCDDEGNSSHVRRLLDAEVKEGPAGVVLCGGPRVEELGGA